MKISYNWLLTYLPDSKKIRDFLQPEKLSAILTSIGLEVENLSFFQSIKGGLEHLTAGEVIELVKHPNADKLKVARVTVGPETLQIVCGASNIQVGQKVIVALPGTEIHPLNQSPFFIEKSKIRGVESEGMICAADEVGISNDHSGIYVLPVKTKPGTPVCEIIPVYTDWVYEIGLTPNRMDAMSHIGVARDVCAWLSHDLKSPVQPVLPLEPDFSSGSFSSRIKAIIEAKDTCPRYAGILIENIEVKNSPEWLQNYLNAIGQRSINNIVDATNFILHECGQPLHAYDADAIDENTIVVRKAAEGEPFITLDQKERILSSEDLMVCDPSKGLCIAGVFGGAKSGVQAVTKNIFLESAWFNPASIRRTSFRHDLRTDAALRFEKGVDVSQTVVVLKRAALLISEITGGRISGDIIDVYPEPSEKKHVTVTYEYIHKLTGKLYDKSEVKNILISLGFTILSETPGEFTVAVPLSKTDISLPADIVEEILRIDGIDNIPIPSSISITPAHNNNKVKETVKNRIAFYLSGRGLREIVTNSITNSRYYGASVLNNSVRLINNLSSELDILRPSLLETGLESLAYNINRQSPDLQFYEMGKTYAFTNARYIETEHVCLWLTGMQAFAGWKRREKPVDFFFLKGLVGALLNTFNVDVEFEDVETGPNGVKQLMTIDKTPAGFIQSVNSSHLKLFNIKEEVFFGDIWLEPLLKAIMKNPVVFNGLPRFPVVQRDLAIVTEKTIPYKAVKQALDKTVIKHLQKYHLFDVFENEKLGAEKKSFAIKFTFSNWERTLLDAEVEESIAAIINQLKNTLNAEIRS